MKSTLLHLVSGERMQNLLPLLALRPDRVIQVCSDEPLILDAAKHTENAARMAGIDAEFQIHKLPGGSPTTDHVRHAHKQLLPIFPGAVVNITGGTKLMSLGAYLGASEFHDSPILYCDTKNRTFIQAGRVALPAHLASFSEAVSRLTVPIVMAAQGKNPSTWRFDTASPRDLAFGKSAWSLRTGSPDSFAAFGRQLRSFYRPENGRIPAGAAKLNALAAADLTSAIQGQPNPAVRSFLNAASAAGFLANLPDGGFRIADGPENKTALRKHIEKIANLLDGSWLELAVLAFISGSVRHKNPHWSVEPAGQADAEYGETDIVAVDSSSAALEIISCKTALSQPLEHLEGLRTRANNLGGNHSRATLAVLNPGDAANKDRLRKWGGLLKVNVLIGQEIPAYFEK